jgi:hypothetical protein
MTAVFILGGHSGPIRAAVGFEYLKGDRRWMT